MSFTVDEIARALGAELRGDGTLVVAGVSEPGDAGPDRLALAMSPKYADGLGPGRARAAILWDGADWEALGLDAAIFVPRPRYAMAGVTRLFDPGPEIEAGVHPTASVDPSATLGTGAAIGPFVIVGPGAVLGRGARIAGHASIAEGVRIGDDALIYPGVRVGARVRIGARFIAQPGAVIGSDGFSFVTPEKSRVELAREALGQAEAEAQSWTRIHSLGGVEIGDDVEVGANTAIDAGTIRATRIGDGTKIDNLVHVGHNVEIGRDCLICGQVGIAGSTRIGDRVVLGGQVGVSDNIFVGDDVVAGGGTNIYTNVPSGRAILGSPAVKMETELELRRIIRRLPRLVDDVRALKKAVSNDGGSD